MIAPMPDRYNVAAGLGAGFVWQFNKHEFLSRFPRRRIARREIEINAVVGGRVAHRSALNHGMVRKLDIAPAEPM